MKNEQDIVNKLRSYKRDRSGYAEYCHRAADEIESLRQQLADSQKREVMLRDALRSAADTLWHFAPAKTADKAEEALAATEPKE